MHEALSNGGRLELSLISLEKGLQVRTSGLKSETDICESEQRGARFASRGSLHNFGLCSEEMVICIGASPGMRMTCL